MKDDELKEIVSSTSVMIYGLQEDHNESRESRTQQEEKKTVDILETLGKKMT